MLFSTYKSRDEGSCGFIPSLAFAVVSVSDSGHFIMNIVVSCLFILHFLVNML